jgi:hypothetical protein
VKPVAIISSRSGERERFGHGDRTVMHAAHCQKVMHAALGIRCSRLAADCRLDFCSEIKGIYLISEAFRLTP